MAEKNNTKLNKAFDWRTYPQEVLETGGAGLEGMEKRLYERFAQAHAEQEKLKAVLNEITNKRLQVIGMLNKVAGRYEETRLLMTEAARDRLAPGTVIGDIETAAAPAEPDEVIPPINQKHEAA